MHTILDERTKLILKAIVNDYIISGEPVGSRTISKRYKINLSPATIRNIMSDLEEIGYIVQPYTSAGRVPTDMGYRFYVNELAVKNQLPKQEIKLIKEALVSMSLMTEETLKSVSKVLSVLSNYSGIVLLRKFEDTNFNHIEFIKLSRKNILAIFITSSGMAYQKIIEFQEDLSQDMLNRISHYLNREFKGIQLKKIREIIVKLMSEEKQQYDNLLKKTIDLSKTLISSNTSEEKLYVGGTSNILEHPEFLKDVDKMKDLFRAFEEKDKLLRILEMCIDSSGISVLIGNESHLKEVEGCSIVTHNFSYNGEVLGTLGIIGPKRMEYEKMISIVNYIAEYVTGLISK